MANKNDEANLAAAGSWAKRYFLASRALMEAILRPFDLGNTQWYVVYLLANHGPINQRDLTRTLEAERATLSAVLSVLVRKELIEQTPDREDQRQKVLHITPAGRDLFESIPDPIALITSVAFQGVDEAEIVTTQRVLSGATQRPIEYKKETNTS